MFIPILLNCLTLRQWVLEKRYFCIGKSKTMKEIGVIKTIHDYNAIIGLETTQDRKSVV